MSSNRGSKPIKAEDRPWCVCGNCAHIIRIMDCYLIEDGHKLQHRGVDDLCNFNPSRFQMQTGIRSKMGGREGRGGLEK